MCGVCVLCVRCEWNRWCVRVKMEVKCGIENHGESSDGFAGRTGGPVSQNRHNFFSLEKPDLHFIDGLEGMIE